MDISSYSFLPPVKNFYICPKVIGISTPKYNSTPTLKVSDFDPNNIITDVSELRPNNRYYAAIDEKNLKLCYDRDHSCKNKGIATSYITVGESYKTYNIKPIGGKFIESVLIDSINSPSIKIKTPREHFSVFKDAEISVFTKTDSGLKYNYKGYQLPIDKKVLVVDSKFFTTFYSKGPKIIYNTEFYPL